ncbi:hypothetical protein H257_14500 [Aphanomyces astaci]|uniref:DDE Tnp4 domain-containing protein n=1 Tax=Aphanomyces astaci TaxID=112090 RepID=W4FSH0_APHAT|nr:hypothetical protein H257_14500 [Aphanomyces astaci]ETV69901.1 hypothetical protein H257_14500 [Aphanomyces astaci]|eukprot:XP_009840639.1 hypothetical protein H257_14500 [Aphanomyces astaci]
MSITQRNLMQLVPFAKTLRQRATLLALMAAYVVERPLIPDIRFSLETSTDATAILDYRFDIAVHRDEAMCVLLGRLAFPVRFHTMTKTFARSRSDLCDIFMHVINVLYAQWGSLLYFNEKLVAKNIDRYYSAVASKGTPLSNVFGFIDGTKIQTCRITATGDGANLQKQIFSGHKLIHCLNYQGVTAPDGICVHFFGPVEGRRHDATMLRESGLIKYLGGRRNVFWGKAMYGDPAYGIVPYLISGFKGINFSNKKMQFNKWMSRVRQSVE